MNATHEAHHGTPALLTTEDVAALLHLSHAHVRRLLAAGELPGRRRGRRWYVLADDLAAEFRATNRPRRRSTAPPDAEPNGRCSTCGEPRSSYRARWCDACEARADRERRP